MSKGITARFAECIEISIQPLKRRNSSINRFHSSISQSHLATQTSFPRLRPLRTKRRPGRLWPLIILHRLTLLQPNIRYLPRLASIFAATFIRACEVVVTRLQTPRWIRLGEHDGSVGIVMCRDKPFMRALTLRVHIKGIRFARCYKTFISNYNNEIPKIKSSENQQRYELVSEKKIEHTNTQRTNHLILDIKPLLIPSQRLIIQKLHNQLLIPTKRHPLPHLLLPIPHNHGSENTPLLFRRATALRALVQTFGTADDDGLDKAFCCIHSGPESHAWCYFCGDGAGC